jgi:hypothetical protein
MGRARCAQGACAFGISGNGAARLPKEMGQTCGNKNNQACDSPLLDRDGELHGVIALLAFDVRTSKPGSVGSMLESLIGLPHLAHGKTPISATLNNGSGRVGGMMLACVGRERAALSVTGRSHRQGRRCKLVLHVRKRT